MRSTFLLCWKSSDGPWLLAPYHSTFQVTASNIPSGATDAMGVSSSAGGFSSSSAGGLLFVLQAPREWVRASMIRRCSLEKRAFLKMNESAFCLGLILNNGLLRLRTTFAAVLPIIR